MRNLYFRERLRSKKSEIKDNKYGEKELKSRLGERLIQMAGKNMKKISLTVLQRNESKNEFSLGSIKLTNICFQINKY